MIKESKVLSFVETDEAVEYIPNKGLTKLQYEKSKDGYFFSHEFYPATQLPLRFVIFPGVMSCHLVIGYNAISDTFWFSHVSCNQISSQYIPDYIRQPPPAYSQLLSENYNNEVGIRKDKKVNFFIVDKANYFDNSVFYSALGERINFLKVIRPSVNYALTAVFICFDLLQKKLFFIKSPFTESDYPSSVINMDVVRQNTTGCEFTKNEQEPVDFITRILLGLI